MPKTPSSVVRGPDKKTRDSRSGKRNLDIVFQLYHVYWTLKVAPAVTLSTSTIAIFSYSVLLIFGIGGFNCSSESLSGDGATQIFRVMKMPFNVNNPHRIFSCAFLGVEF